MRLKKLIKKVWDFIKSVRGSMKNMFYGEKRVDSSPTTTKDDASITSKQPEYLIPTPLHVPETASRYVEHLGCRFFIRKAYYKGRELRVMYDKDREMRDDSYEFFQQECDIFASIHPVKFYEWYK